MIHPPRPDRPSSNFTWHEVERSTTADRLQLDNRLPDHLVANVLLMAARLEWVREVCGGVGVQPSSWYRAPAVNRAVGSSDVSAHPLGLAVDFRVTGQAPRETHRLIARSDIPYDQLLIERNAAGTEWVHLGLFRVPRREVMDVLWDALLKKMVYRRVAVS